MLKRLLILSIVCTWALLAHDVGAAPITVPMVDDATIYSFDGATSIDLNASVFDSQFSTRSGAFWFNATDTAPLQMLYEEGGRINGLNIFIDQGQIRVGAWASRSGQWLSQSITANQWHHVAYVFDQGQFSLFYDGNHVQSVTTAFSTIPSHSGANALGAVNDWTLVGNSPADQLSSSSYYPGLLAGVSYDDSALVLSDLNDIASRTSPSPVPPAALLFGSGLAGLVVIRKRKNLRI